MDTEILEIESKIKQIMDEINSPILTIPEISYRMDTMSLAGIEGFSRFALPDKIPAYAGASLCYQSR